MTDFSGRILGPYKLEQQLGKGGMATVYRAYQTTVKRYVAVKVMSPEIASDPGFVERFTREAELIAALQHPHILPVIDYGESDGTHYLVMRYIEGGSLDDLLRRKQLTFDETSRLLGQIASALDYAHKKGVIHRDFKPNNVLLDSDGNAYLTDFGIARLTTSDRNLTVTGAIMGTPAYMSPEQGMGKTVDARADLYSLGVVLYEMVVGRLPFTGDTPASLIFQHAFQPPAPPQQFRPEIPMSVVGVITRALAKDPDDRYQSGEEMVRAYDEAVGKRAAPSEGDGTITGLEDSATIIGDMPGGRPSARSTPPPPSSVRNPTPPGPGTFVPRTGTGATGMGTPPPPSATGAGAGGYGGAGGTVPPAAYTPPPSYGATPAGYQSVPPSATPAPPPPVARRGAPIPLIIGAVAVIAVLLGIGGIVVVNNNNAAATSEGLTRVAVIALSATKTPTVTATATDTETSTPTPSRTPTATASPTITPTPTQTLTPTPNLTETAISQRLTALAQIEANGTATANAQAQATLTQQANFAATAIALLTRSFEQGATATAAAATATAGGAQTAVAAAIVAATQTQDAQNNADAQATATRSAANLRATSLAATATARAVRVTPTRTPVPPPTGDLGPYSGGKPEDVIAKLGQDGILDSTDGLLQVGPLEGDIDPVDTPNYYRWRMLGTYSFTNFVASAEFTWKNAGADGECGLMARYSQPSSNTFRFHVFTVSVAKTYRVITYKDTSDSLVKRGTANSANTGDGDKNQILLIGQGTHFRLFLNGVQVTDINLPDFDSGTVAIMAATLKDTGIACSFKNSWVYELNGGGPTNPGDLLSNKPEDVIAALETSKTIAPGSATVAATDPSNALSSKAGDAQVFYRVDVPSSPSLSSFVLSTDVTWANSDASTACGVQFFGTRGPSNLISFSLFPNSDYYLEAYLNGQWQNNALDKGNDAIINGKKGTTNRITVVVTGGTATIFVNAKKLIEENLLPLSTGNAGYFLSIGQPAAAETCKYANTTLWKLSK